jgi:hypothetical protein
MTSEAIDLDRSRLRLCIEILPEDEESPERLVIISIYRDSAIPMIRTIALSELTPIPIPLAKIIRDYAESDLAAPIEPTEENLIADKPIFSSSPKQTAPSFKPQQQALQLW